MIKKIIEFIKKRFFLIHYQLKRKGFFMRSKTEDLSENFNILFYKEGFPDGLVFGIGYRNITNNKYYLEMWRNVDKKRAQFMIKMTDIKKSLKKAVKRLERFTETSQEYNLIPVYKAIVDINKALGEL